MVAYKYSIFCFVAFCISTIECGLLTPAPVPVALAAAPGALPVNTEIDPHPQYAYAYNVQDALTGDSKSQQEVRDGDVVKGSYSVLDADGSLRTVFYTADPINGFNAIVQRGPVPVAVAPVARPTALGLAAAPVPLPIPARLF